MVHTLTIFLANAVDLAAVGGEDEGRDGNKDGEHGGDVAAGQPHLLLLLFLPLHQKLRNPGMQRADVDEKHLKRRASQHFW